MEMEENSVCSDDLELHLHGGWRRILLCWFGAPSAWRMEENAACSDNLEDE